MLSLRLTNMKARISTTARVVRMCDTLGSLSYHKFLTAKYLPTVDRWVVSLLVTAK